MKNILFVSVAFPPKSDPECLQTAKYFHHLQKHKDLKIDVVTSAIPTLYMPYDKHLEVYAEGLNQLVSVKLRENRYINYLRNRLGLESFVFPDVKHSFHKQFRKVIKRLRQKPDLIYSRADPKSSIIMAYKLCQYFKVPWILHMSDPWADCPLQCMTGRNYKKHDDWERKCFEAANLISLTSIPTIEFYKKKYPELSDKFIFYPNVYENSNYDKNISKYSKNDNKKFRIVYTGGLAGSRSPEYFLEPLKQLINDKPALAESMEVIFAGDVDAKNRAVFQNYSLPCVNWIGKISFKEALELQQSANYLLLIDSPIKDVSKSMFFPSKLLDYMVARKRILAITTKGSAAYEVMQDLKGDVCSYNETEEIKNSIIRTYDAFQKGDNNYLANDKPPEKYEASWNADRLYNQIVELLNE